MTMKTKNLLLIKTNWTETCRSVPLELRYYLTQEDPDTGARTEPVRRDCRSVSERGKLTRGGFGYHDLAGENPHTD